MSQLEEFLSSIESVIWGVPLLVLIAAVGIFLTCLLRGVQFRYFLRAFKFLGTKESEAKGDISPLQSLMTAMASAVGTGSIVGVSTAICLGGIGAVFWMWVMGFLGMAVKYGESLLAVKFRITDKRGEMSGGPMYYIERGLGWKWLALFYAGAAAIATIGTGNLVQVKAIADSVHSVLHVDQLVTGCVVALITGVVLLRGIKNIGFVSTVLVPIMAAFYILAGCAVLIAFRQHVPAAIGMIFSCAFTGQAAVGGFAGATVLAAIQFGISRSILSSEAGVGISSIAAAAARTTSSSRQALLSMTASILSTSIICTITALVIAVTGSLGKVDETGTLLNGASLAITAFSSAFYGGEYIVMTGLALFAYTTIIGWAYYGEKCCEYLFGERSVVPYRILYTLVLVPGAIFALNAVWSFSNITNALMVIPNMIALFGLAKVILKETDEFIATEGKKPVLDGAAYPS